MPQTINTQTGNAIVIHMLMSPGQQQGNGRQIAQTDQPTWHRPVLKPNRCQRHHEHRGHPDRISLDWQPASSSSRTRSSPRADGSVIRRYLATRPAAAAVETNIMAKNSTPLQMKTDAKNLSLIAPQPVADHPDEPQKLMPANGISVFAIRDVAAATVQPFGRICLALRHFGANQDHHGAKQQRKDHTGQRGSTWRRQLARAA
jgi:hypothetical protein